MKLGALTLIADIGGTNARFGLARAGQPLRLLDKARTADHPSMVEAILDLVHGKAGEKPEAAILALAGPVTGPSVKLTNGPWRIEARALIERCGLRQVLLLNDFEAQALALPVLEPEHLVAVGDGTIVPGAPKLVIGPGTGLGCAALIDAGGWRPVGGEGGHVERNPLTPRERRFWPHVERESERVDAEQILSGPGLLRLYRALAKTDGVEAEFGSSEAVLAAGLAGKGLAREAMEHFAVQFGRYAGDLALVFMARGGVYLAGGMALRMATFLAGSGFRAAFDDKPPYRDIMPGIGVSVVVHPDAALAGLAGMVDNPGNYAVPTAGRLWRAGDF
jgi:glucokinase